MALVGFIRVLFGFHADVLYQLRIFFDLGMYECRELFWRADLRFEALPVETLLHLVCADDSGNRRIQARDYVFRHSCGPYDAVPVRIFVAGQPRLADSWQFGHEGGTFGTAHGEGP